MQSHVSLSAPEQPQGAVKVFFTQHPVWSAVLILVAFVTLAGGVGMAAQTLLPQFQPEFIALTAMAALVALALSALGWWQAAGFNRPTEWRDARLMVIPFLIVVGLPFLLGVKASDSATFGYLAIAYALTGFMEEGLMRGIVMHILKPLGPARSVALSALLFGLMHIGNLLYRNPAIVAAQMLGAFVHGIGLGAIRLRTNTVWFAVILHALHDLALKYTNFPAIPLDVVQVTLLMGYGIYLLRGWQRTEAAA